MIRLFRVRVSGNVEHLSHMEINLNCDLGEGCPHDAELMLLITSANIACGFHAGDPATAHTALLLAARHGVQIGAHPGFADREHFGRRELERTETQIFEECVYQIGALAGLARAAGVALRYVKPHGALYNMACRDDAYARPIVEAVALFSLDLMALPESRLEALSAGKCLFVREPSSPRCHRRRQAPQDGSSSFSALDDARTSYSKSAVAHALADMTQRKGWLTNRKDSYGKGYGLPDWS